MTTISLEDAGVYVQNLKGDLLNKAVSGVRLAATRGLQVVQTRIIPSRKPQPVDRGIYRAGWKVVPIEMGAMIYNDSPVAAIIEYGARAANVKIGRAMLQALAEWCIRKGLVKPQRTPRMLTKEGRAEMKKAKAIKLQADALAMAWAIAKKMKAGKGIHNQRPGGGLRIQEELRQMLPQIIREEVNRRLGS